MAGALLWAGCLGDAPRDNPFDALSEDYEGAARLSGRVTGFYAPFAGLADVEVRLLPGPFVVNADAEGRFVFPQVPAQTYEIIAEKEGYAPASDTVALAVGAERNKELRLSGTPVVTGLRLITSHVSRWWPPPLDAFGLTIISDVDDPDGFADIDSVWLEVEDLNYAVALQPTQDPGRFQRSFTELELPAPTLHALQGHELYIHVLDRAGVESEGEPLFLSRIIDTTPIAGNPQGGAALSTTQPTLSWQPVRLLYPFTYRVEVTRADLAAETVIWQQDQLDAGTTAVQVGVPLVPGATYNWTLDIVDEFGNWSRSKPAGFLIVQ